MRSRIESVEVIVIDPETDEPMLHPATGLPITQRINVEYPVDDAYILAHRPPTILLTASALNVAVNGTITLSAQLRTPELADFSYQNLGENRAITLKIGDVVQVVNLVNGFWSDTLQFVIAGNHVISCDDLPCVPITVVVT